jgi:hypothetical protein
MLNFFNADYKDNPATVSLYQTYRDHGIQTNIIERDSRSLNCPVFGCKYSKFNA